eukprot:scaffold157943_cov15-Prasinocladus_malaysianus.AAC.1
MDLKGVGPPGSLGDGRWWSPEGEGMQARHHHADIFCQVGGLLAQGSALWNQNMVPGSTQSISKDGQHTLAVTQSSAYAFRVENDMRNMGKKLAAMQKGGKNQILYAHTHAHKKACDFEGSVGNSNVDTVADVADYIADGAGGLRAWAGQCGCRPGGAANVIGNIASSDEDNPRGHTRAFSALAEGTTKT